MSKLIAMVDQGKYVPWQRPVTHLGAKVRVPYQLLWAGMLTCWEVNTGHSGVNSSWLMTVPSCAACALFHSDKDLLSHL
jgi:hypothetical protein